MLLSRTLPFTTGHKPCLQRLLSTSVPIHEPLPKPDDPASRMIAKPVITLSSSSLPYLQCIPARFLHALRRQVDPAPAVVQDDGIGCYDFFIFIQRAVNILQQLNVKLKGV